MVTCVGLAIALAAALPGLVDYLAATRPYTAIERRVEPARNCATHECGFFKPVRSHINHRECGVRPWWTASDQPLLPASDRRESIHECRPYELTIAARGVFAIRPDASTSGAVNDTIDGDAEPTIYVDGEPLRPLTGGWSGSVGAHVAYWCRSGGDRSGDVPGEGSCDVDADTLVQRHMGMGMPLDALLAFKAAAILQFGGVARADAEALRGAGDGARIARARNPAATGLYASDGSGALCVRRWRQLEDAAIYVNDRTLARLRICAHALSAREEVAKTPPLPNHTDLRVRNLYAQCLMAKTEGLHYVTQSLLAQFAAPDATTAARVLGGLLPVTWERVTAGSLGDLFTVLEPSHWLWVHAPLPNDPRAGSWEPAWPLGALARQYHRADHGFAAREDRGADRFDLFERPDHSPYDLTADPAALASQLQDAALASAAAVVDARAAPLLCT